MTRNHRSHTSAMAAGAVLVALGMGVETAAAQVTAPPPPLEERPIEFPEFRDMTLENGLRVVILPYGTQPVMSANLYLPGGGSLDPADRAGLASMTASVLTRGTRPLGRGDLRHHRRGGRVAERVRRSGLPDHLHVGAGGPHGCGPGATAGRGLQRLLPR